MIGVKRQTVKSTVYDTQYYLKLMEGRESFLKGKIEDRFYEALNLSSLSCNLSVLDLGTGRGEMAVLCAKAGAKVEAVDYSPDSIRIAKEYAQKNLSQSELRKVKFKVMNAKKLEYKDQVFDRIFFLETLEHLYPQTAKEALLEIKRVLKPEGVLVLSTGPNALLVKPLLFLGSIVTGRKTWKSRKYHVNEQNFFGLRKLLLSCGFTPLIKVGHSRNWLYGQVSNNKNISDFLKAMFKLINKIWDAGFFYEMRKLPLFEKILGTHFLCLCQKR